MDQIEAIIILLDLTAADGQNLTKTKNPPDIFSKCRHSGTSCFDHLNRKDTTSYRFCKNMLYIGFWTQMLTVSNC